MPGLTNTDHQKTGRVAVVAFALIVALVTWLILALFSWVGALGFAAVVAAFWTISGWKNAADVILDLCDAEPADETRHARLFNTTAGLCTAMGVSPPTLYVVEDPAINLLVAGTNTRSASLVVTEGALEELNVLEFEALIAFGLHKIKNGSVVAQSFVVPTYGAALVLAEAADAKPGLAKALSTPSNLIGKVIQAVRPPRQDIVDDLEAVGYTRSPPALANALEKMSGHSALAVAPVILAHLWIAPSLGTSVKGKFADLHSPLEERIAVLREL